ncbi:hypothetical protein B0T10DRAFT_561742 [Thelonectria olida]|uniref:Uncharacterized protein n=1 Tax=Thelonectria olida TaxID=1576542 RepID=A0A9P9APR6_9HYPO|nr:hypothetical protein B0T10DRAFT_561742 [Thelonectria olida]
MLSYDIETALTLYNSYCSVAMQDIVTTTVERDAANTAEPSQTTFVVRVTAQNTDQDTPTNTDSANTSEDTNTPGNSAQFSGASVSSGTFTDGPFGIGSGGILTSGAAVGALPNGDHYVNNGAPGSDTYCNVNTFNAAILTVDLFVSPPHRGINVQYIVASEEEGGSSDPIGIFVGGEQKALDGEGNKITATSRYLEQPIAIIPPDSVTSYPGSSPPLLVGILATGALTVVLAICDQGDTEWDSAFLVKAEGCVDCNTEFRLAYVTTTTTVEEGSTTFTSTTKASGTVSGTIVIGVEAEITTSTTTSEELDTDNDAGLNTDIHKHDFDYDEHNVNNNHRVDNHLRVNHKHNFLYNHFTVNYDFDYDFFNYIYRVDYYARNSRHDLKLLSYRHVNQPNYFGIDSVENDWIIQPVKFGLRKHFIN